VSGEAGLRTRFGTVGHEYETYRRGYAEAVYDLIAEVWGVKAGATVVDVGCGTGLATRALAERGVRVTGVEPDAGMRERAQRLLAGAAEVVDGLGERLPFADGSADAVTAAQAAHWFTEPAASREIQRVLRPGGAAVYWWKHPDPREPYLTIVNEQMVRLAGSDDLGGYSPTVWPSLLGAGFTGFRRDTVEQDVEYTVDSYLGYLASTSTFSREGWSERKAVLEAVRTALHARLPEGRFVERNVVYVFGARTEPA
jgi:SAM-dependent methyltransferase